MAINTYWTGTLVSVTATFKDQNGNLYNPSTVYGAYIIQPFNKNGTWSVPVVTLYGQSSPPFNITNTGLGIYVMQIPTPLPGIYIVSSADQMPDNFTGTFHQTHSFQAKTPPV